MSFKFPVSCFQQPRPGRDFRRGFTLVELLCAVALLVLVILSVGLIFRSTGKAVGLAQVSGEIFSNVRAVDAQLASDLSRLARNGFLVIRSRTSGGRRVDQLAFVAGGGFAHRTGSTDANPFNDATQANAALIWVGHLLYQGQPDQSSSPYAGSLNDASFDSGTTFWLGQQDTEMRLGRRALLLAAPGGVLNAQAVVGTTAPYAPAFASPAVGEANVLANASTDGTVPANIASSRIDAVALTPQQLMTALGAAVGDRSQGITRYEADAYCFRSFAPRNAYDVETAVSSPVVGSLRMNSILLQCCASFSVEWTDGTVYQAGTVNGATIAANDPRIGQLVWYGLGNPRLAQDVFGVWASDPTVQPPLDNGDAYTATFSFDNRAAWPKALRLVYRVTDPRDRLNGGRTFTQIVKLPG